MGIGRRRSPFSFTLFPQANPRKVRRSSLRSTDIGTRSRRHRGPVRHDRPILLDESLNRLSDNLARHHVTAHKFQVLRTDGLCHILRQDVSAFLIDLANIDALGHGTTVGDGDKGDMR